MLICLKSYNLSENGDQTMKRVKKALFSKKITEALFVLLQLGFFYISFYALSEYSPYLFGGANILSAIVILIVINREMDSGMKISWAFIIAAVPVFGVALYSFVRLDLATGRIKKRLRDIYDSTSYLNENDTLVLKRIVSDSEKDAGLIRYIKEYSGYFPYQNTDIQYFSLGDDAYPVILSELKRAQKYIFIEFFIIDSGGEMWKEIYRILQNKVKNGVEVKILYDAMGSLLTTPPDFPAQLKKAGIQCEPFAPIKPFLSTYHNNRDHRKIIVIDGKTAFSGGINLADEYINRAKKYGHWKDNAVMVKGDAVKSYTLMFLRMWNSIPGKSVNYEKYISASPINHKKRENGYVVAFDDAPFREERVTRNVYVDMINSAKDCIYIMTPYLVLDDGMHRALNHASKRGVDVRIIMPHIPDKKTTFSLSRTYYPDLISNGVKIYEYTPGFVHSKTTLCDGVSAFVGTVNYDYRSMFLNYECGLYISQNSILEDIQNDFDATFSKSQIFTLEDYYSTSLFMRIVGRILRVIAPLM